MDRQLFILEDITSCAQFLNEAQTTNAQSKKILGIGSFFTNTNEKTEKGLFIHVIPSFLTNDLRQEIINGHISVFEKNSIFFQKQSPTPFIPISNWILFGHHLGSFASQKSTCMNEITTALTQASSPEEFIHYFLTDLTKKIEEIKPDIAVFLFDPKTLSFYIKSLFQVLKKPIFSSQINPEIDDLENRITYAFILFLSHSQNSTIFVIVPSHQKYYKTFLSFAHKIQKNTPPPDSFLFKL